MNLENKKATRQSYGEALVELGKKNNKVVVLDADLAGATKTSMFKKEFEDRFFDMGISEQDMVATAAGFATCGLIPFASTFAVFATGRAYDQIRNSICYPNLNVKICATHAGITVGEDGATHQMLEDINLMRGLPKQNGLLKRQLKLKDQYILDLEEHQHHKYMKKDKNSNVEKLLFMEMELMLQYLQQEYLLQKH